MIHLGSVLRMGVCWTLALLMSYIQLLWRPPPRLPRIPLSSHNHNHNRSLNLNHNLKLACIVTGASAGIGKAIVDSLAKQGYHVILAGPSISRLLKVTEEMKRNNNDVSCAAMELDLSSVASIIKFAESVKVHLQEHCPGTSLQLLVNNAGILAASQRLALDGYDCMVATNFLGPFILTHLLLPLLQKCVVPSRIVNVASFTHRCVQSLQFTNEWLARSDMKTSSASSKCYRMAHNYELSKMCIVLLSYALVDQISTARLASQITVMVADPGAVRSEILRELPTWLQSITFTVLTLLGLLSSPEKGAQTVVDAALAPANISGMYFFGGKGQTICSSPLSYKKELAQKLWETTATFCNEVLSYHNSYKTALE